MSARRSTRLSHALVSIALCGAVIGSLGAPLITPVATGMHVPLDVAQWTLTVTLFTGAIAGPVLGRLGSGSHRRATILATLALVTLGGALTAAPLPFAALLVGRGLQGLGLGVVALLMSVARDQLPAERSASAIAMISVASTVGVGVGYPLIGLLDQLAGLRVAYGFGFLLSLGALAIAWLTLPRDAPAPPVQVDAPAPPVQVDAVGALLLGAGTLGLLLAIAEPTVWKAPLVGGAIIVAAAIALGFWVAVELKAAAPLVDLRLLAQSAVLRANTGMLVAGVGMYLLFSLLTRYVQTPATAGYGFALPGVAAGAALIPFSVLGFIAGRVAPAAIARSSGRTVYAAAAISVMIAAALFAAAPDSPVAVLGAMAVLGFGVGGVSAVMPRLVLAGVPHTETASVLLINQIIRSIGFGIGSALAGMLLAGATRPGALSPQEHGYLAAAQWVLPLLALSIVVVALSRRRRTR
ncbi:MAG TPA: MFS transporter [Humibacter sp.]|nr:MFS transporter [Humibacter sp.]